MKYCLLLLSLVIGLTACNNGSGGSTTWYKPGVIVYNESSLSLGVGESSNLVVTYEGTNSPEYSLQVNFNFTESNISVVSPTTCKITQANNSCIITVTGINVGYTSLYATTPYLPIGESSVKITVR